MDGNVYHSIKVSIEFKEKVLENVILLEIK